MKKYINNDIVLALVFLIILMLKAFRLKLFPGPTIDYIFWGLLLSLSTFSLKGKYSKLIVAYLFFLTISCIYSWIFNGQRIIVTIIHSFDYYAIFFYFVLFRFRPSYKDVERVMLVVAFCFCFCYILQWLIFPVILFTGGEHHVTEDFYRSRMPGSISCYFLFFYGINKLLLNKEVKYGAYSLFAFFPIIIQGFRSLIALTAVSAFLIIPFVLRSGKKSILYSLLGVGVILALLNMPLVQTKLAEMERRQLTDQTFENSDYIRYRSFDYYWNEYYTKPYEKVIGGGLHVDSQSRYTKRIKEMNQIHFWIEDLGIVGLSMMIGIPAVVCLVIIYLLCMYRCKSPDLQCIRFTLFVALIGSLFTTMELYRPGNLLILPLFLYMEYQYHIEKNRTELFDEKNRIAPRLLRMYSMR